MEDFKGDRLLSFSEAAASLPGTPHVSTLHRWRLRGVKGHKLSTEMWGGRRFIRASALQDFVDKVTAAADIRSGDRQPSRRRSQRVKDAQIRVDRELRASN